MEQIKKTLSKIIAELFGETKADIVLTAAPKNMDADYSTNVAMLLARELHRNPMEIASEIVKKYDEMYAEGAEVRFPVEIAAPGFLNFISPDEYFVEKIEDFGKNFTKIISCDDYEGDTVICEFSDPNPFKVLHVGHLYTSMVGDSISRLVEFAGGKVVRANFGGDVGLHVAKTLYAILNGGVSEGAAESVGAKEGGAAGSAKDGAVSSAGVIDVEKLDIETIAKAYVEGTRAYEDDPAAKDEIVRLNKMIYEIALAGENETEGADAAGAGAGGVGRDGRGADVNADGAGDTEEDLLREKLAKYYWRGREISYDYFKDFYARIGLKFDKYYPESTVAVRGLEEVKKGLAKGVYEESDGAIVYKGEKKGLHTRVFINKNGLPTYEAKDVGLIFTKFDDYHFDKSIVITGNDIIDYMKVVLSSVGEMKPELPERTLHLTHGNVRLPGNEKMSSRKGNFIRAVDVLDAVAKASVSSANALIEQRAENVDTQEQKKAVVKADDKIVLGAAKYAFLKYKIGGNIEFDVDSSVSMTGNSGPYLQYSAVRAKKILANTMKNGVSANSKQWELDTRERELIKKIVEYPEVLGVAVKELAPNKICTYLYELAQEFSRFYENIQVSGSPFEFERGQIVLAYLKVMIHGLGLLGIEVPDKM